MRTDAELLAAYAATGGEAAFAELAGRHGPMVYRVCLRALDDAHEAEDAAQAVFVILARKAKSLRPDVDLAAWLHGTARNAAALCARTRARRARREEEAAMARAVEQSPAAGAEPTVPLREHLDRELAALPAVQRQAVILRYLEGRTQEQAAAVAGCPQGTLARRATVGLEKLRERLARKKVSDTFSCAALAGWLAAEAQTALPGSLLPALLAASKLAAAGAAAGAAGSKALVIAEGALKAMFWMKLKIAAAVLVCATALGAGTPLVYKAVAGDGPAAGSRDAVIKEVAPGKPQAPAVPPAAEARAVNGLKLSLIAETSPDEQALRAGESPMPEDQIRDIEKKLDKKVTFEFVAAPASEAIGFLAAVSGISMVVDPPSLKKPAEEGGPKPVTLRMQQVPLAEALDRTLAEAGLQREYRDGGIFISVKQDLGSRIRCRLRWENVGAGPLVLSRDPCCDLYDHVFLKGPAGELAAARQDNRQRRRHLGPRVVEVAPRKAEEERFDPWFWVVKPEAPGEYTLWVEFEGRRPANEDRARGYWTGKVRSNEVKVRIGAARPALAGTNHVEQALAWLAKVQEPDGHWDSAKHGARPADDVAAAAGAALAFLAAGHTDRNGVHKDSVRRALDWLVSRQKEDGSFGRGELAGLLAPLALCEAWGMTNNEARKAPALKAIAFVEKRAAEGGGLSAQSLAWVSASANAGGLKAGPEAGIARAFADTLADNAGTSFKKAPALLPAEFLFYIDSLGGFMQGGETWRNFNARMREKLLPGQEQAGELAGSWKDAPFGDSSQTGRVLATALNAMALEVYYRYLPVYGGRSGTVRKEPPAAEPKPAPEVF